MATFDEFYSSLDSDRGIRGKEFEKFVKWFLKNDPVWASQVKDIWLWDEHPKRSEWGPDCGIDLVFDNFLGEIWAVQAKCFAPESSIKKEDMDSFISESSDSRFQGRLLVASTDRIGTNADRLLNRHEVVRYLLDDFRNSPIIFPNCINELSIGKTKKKKDPLPHQKDAINAVYEGLKTLNRGQVLMACGTGKTLTSLWIKEKLEAKEVLILLPSLSLLSQTLKEWNANASIPFKWICVCSDKSVARKDKIEDDWVTNTSEIGVPVTNEIQVINNFLGQKGFKVIFSTYQSSPLIAQAQKENKKHNFDIVFADEAHRCAGTVSEAFGCVLDSKNIKANKRLFLTATPKVFTNQTKGQAKSRDIELVSMDDRSFFGDILYNLKFSDAINNKPALLTDYKLIVIGVDDEMIHQQIENRNLISLKDGTIVDSENLASHIALAKIIEKYDLNSVITFHSKVKSAKFFAEVYPKVANWGKFNDHSKRIVNCDYVHGNMTAYERKKKLNILKSSNQEKTNILSNARCLSEGVDVPALDGIAFMDPKRSQNDIIQAVGRVIRKSKDKKLGLILVPIYVGGNIDLEESIIQSRFNHIWKIILALKSQDDSIMNELDNVRIQLGRRNKLDGYNRLFEKINFDFPQTFDKNFSEKIKILTIKSTSQVWYENFGLLQKHIELNGNIPVKRGTHLGEWVTRQRVYKNKGILDADKIIKLNSINFDWNPQDSEIIFQENYKLLLKYVNENNQLPDRNWEKGNWIYHMRQYKKKGKLDKNKIKLLEEIKYWFWEKDLDSEWNSIFCELKIWKEVNGKIPTRNENKKLNAWLGTQKQAQKKGKLSNDRLNKLNSIEALKSISDMDIWLEKYYQLKEYLQKNNNVYPIDKSKLGTWISHQRGQFKKGKLNNIRLNYLKEINFIWVGKNISQRKIEENKKIWFENFEKLKNYLRAENNTYPSQKISLGKWVQTQRRKFKEGLLEIDKIEFLNSINFVWIVNKDTQWIEKFEELKIYFKKYGNSLPNHNEFKSLRNWVDRQYYSYKKGTLSDKRFKLLSEIKFDFKRAN